ncbi:MAG: DUF3187 family protein [Nitrospirota bacterium]
MRLCCLHRFRVVVFLLSAVWLASPASLPAAPLVEGFSGEGPFPTRNYNPVQLLFLSMPAEAATTLARGAYEVKLEYAESNIIVWEKTPRVDATLKFETFRFSLQLKHGLTDRLEVGLHVPYLYRNGGFLDPFIISVEKAIASFNVDRLTFTNGSFGGYEITIDGETVISGEDRQSGLGDIVLGGKWLALTETRTRPALAVRAALKLPTGDFGRAFGSEHPDVGVGLALQKSVGRRWSLYLNQSVVFPTGDFGGTDITLWPISSTALAVEFRWTPRFSLVGQVDYFTSPFYNTGTQILDKGVTEAVVGFNYRIRPRVLWQLYGIENFNWPFGAGADFTLGSDVSFRFS